DVFAVGHVEIQGAGAVGDLEVCQRVDSLLAGQTIFTVDAAALARRVGELPFVRSVQVERHLPDGLGIRIVEYRPLALACGGATCWLVSPDGRILTKVPGSEWRGRVPVVRLESSSKVRPGIRLPQEPGLALLLAVPHDLPLDFTSIDVSPYSIVATTGDGVQVRFGRAEHFASKLAAAARILTSWSARTHRIAYVDVSVPSNPATCYQDDTLCRDAPTTTEVAEAHVAKVAAQRHIAALVKAGATQQQISEATYAMNNPEAVAAVATATRAANATGDSTSSGTRGQAHTSDATGTAAQTPKDAFEAATRAE
ncbi:MAG: FtsQ-type POTRA domain-containing protein, partial [Thermoleophilia bacterium]|nr:FtsQ-type POTRA domain-containing protein [Thermoleophilia bacterium]